MVRLWLTRLSLALALAALFAACFPGSRLPAEDWPADWENAATGAREVLGRMIGMYPGSVQPAARKLVDSFLAEAKQLSDKRAGLLNHRDTLAAAELDTGLEKVRQQSGELARRLDPALAGDRSVIRLSGQTTERTVDAAVGSTAVIVHRQGERDAPPAFAWRHIDLASGERERSVEPPPQANYYAVLELVNAIPGSNDYTFHLGADTVKLKVTAPERYRVRVTLLGPDGAPTEAAVGLYAAGGQLLTPDNALDFGAGGFAYRPVNWREHNNTRFWPGAAAHLTRCFFVRGGFSIPLPAGGYRLIVTKGPEFLPADMTLEVKPGDETRQRVQLKRWVDMPAKGWQSGDCHIHYQRSSREANQRLLLWSRAEDLRMNNILRMGDARETYFEQYAFGSRGRFLAPGTAFVPGQEDPRTAVMGHTIQLNLQAPVRDPSHYYLYENIFEQTRRQGGLAGYAHVNADLFNVHRDMTLNVPLGNVDFAEICEFGYIKTGLWYEFLNLGFKLAAAAGSDAPWGGTVGDSRVYVYTGRAFNADDWFSGLRRGRTFVTTGPMLELTVDGKLPGDEIRLAAGRKLRVHSAASAGYLNQPMGTLEIVVNGTVVRSRPVESGRAGLDFDLPLEHSAWVAARTGGAHTTPVYVTIAGERHWARERAAELIATREKQLGEIEALLDRDNATGQGWRGAWESPEAWRAGRERMRESIATARSFYQRLRAEAAPSK